MSSTLDLPADPEAQPTAGLHPDSLWSNSEEEDCCRVCHGEAEESRQLFHPCRCSGSIKFVHQDCLQTWLKISNQSRPKCELCGEDFNFRNIYASGLEGKPPKLTVFEFAQDLCIMMASATFLAVKMCSAIVLWFVLFPYCTYFSVQLADSIAYRDRYRHNSVLYPIVLPKNFIEFLTHWWIGLEYTALVLLFCLVMMRCYEYVNNGLEKLRFALKIAHLEAQIAHLEKREAVIEAQEALFEAERKIITADSEDDTLSDFLADTTKIQHGLNDMSDVIPILASDCSDLHLIDTSIAQREFTADSVAVLREAIPHGKSPSSEMNELDPLCELGSGFSLLFDGFEMDVTTAVEMNIAVNPVDTIDVTVDTHEDTDKDTETAWDQDADHVWRDSVHPVLPATHSTDQNHRTEHDQTTGGGIYELPLISSSVTDITSSASDVGAATTEMAQGKYSTLDIFSQPERHHASNSALNENIKGTAYPQSYPESPTASLYGGLTSDGCTANGVNSNGVEINRTNGVRDVPFVSDVLQEVEVQVQVGADVEVEADVVQPVAEEALDVEEEDAPVLVVEGVRVPNHRGLAPFGLFDFINSMYLALDGVFIGPQPDPPAVIAAFFDFSPVQEHLINFFVFISNMGCLIMALKLGPALVVRLTLAACGLEQSFDTACTEFVCFLLLKIRSPVLVLPLTYEYTRWWLQILFLCQWLVGVSVIGFIIVIAGAVHFYCTLHKPIFKVCGALLIQNFQSSFAVLGTFLKCSSMVVLEACIVPGILGIGADILSLRAFKITLKERFQRCTKLTNLAPSIGVHWLIGTLLYLHFQCALDILDDVLQKDLLLGVLPHFKLLVRRDEMILSCIDDTSALWYIKQLLTDACFYIPALMLTIFVPIRLGHFFFPLSGPVVFRTGSELFDYDVPLETVLFHILVPFMAEKIHYRKIMIFLLENYFKTLCRALDLTDYLSDAFREAENIIRVPQAIVQPEPVAAEEPTAALTDTTRVQLPVAGAGEEENPIAVIAQSIAVFAKANESNISNADLSIWAATIEAFVDATEPQSSRTARALAAAEAAVTAAELAAERAASDMLGDMQTHATVPVVQPTADQETDLARIQIEIELMRDFELAVQQELDAERISKMEANLSAGKLEFPDDGANRNCDTEDADIPSVMAVTSATVPEDVDEVRNNTPAEGLTISSEEHQKDSATTLSSALMERDTADSVSSALMERDTADSVSPALMERDTADSVSPALMERVTADSASRVLPQVYPCVVSVSDAVLKQPFLPPVTPTSLLNIDEDLSQGILCFEVILEKFRHLLGSEFYETHKPTVELMKRSHSNTIARKAAARAMLIEGGRQMMEDALTGGALTSDSIMDIARVHYLPFSSAVFGKEDQSLKKEVKNRARQILDSIKGLPKNVRGAILAILFCLSYSAITSWSLHLPLVVGRGTLNLLSYTMGIGTCWGFNYIVQFIRKDVVTNSNYMAIVRVSLKWAVVVLKIFLLGSVWLTVPPLLLGYLIDVIATGRNTAYNESLKMMPLAQCWTVGIIALKLWVRLMLLRNDNEWAIKFQKVINDGVGNLDALYIYSHIIGPVTIFLLDFTLLPYFFAKCICLFTTSYATQTMLVRQSFPLYLLLRFLIVIGRKLYQYIVTLHDEIRDSRYLLGKELTNR